MKSDNSKYNAVWDFIASFGYNNYDLSVALKEPIETIEKIKNSEVKVSSDIDTKIRKLVFNLLNDRYAKLNF